MLRCVLPESTTDDPGTTATPRRTRKSSQFDVVKAVTCIGTVAWIWHFLNVLRQLLNEHADHDFHRESLYRQWLKSTITKNQLSTMHCKNQFKTEIPKLESLFLVRSFYISISNVSTRSRED